MGSFLLGHKNWTTFLGIQSRPNVNAFANRLVFEVFNEAGSSQGADVSATIADRPPSESPPPLPGLRQSHPQLRCPRRLPVPNALATNHDRLQAILALEKS